MFWLGFFAGISALTALCILGIFVLTRFPGKQPPLPRGLLEEWQRNAGLAQARNEALNNISGTLFKLAIRQDKEAT